MSDILLSPAQLQHAEALRVAHKRVKEMRAFYMNALMYSIVIPVLWVITVSYTHL